MPKYQPVYSQIWKDDCFQELSTNGKLLFVYLITNESINNSGIYHVTTKTISHETGLSEKVISKLLTDGSVKNVTYDDKNSYVFIHKRKQYSPGGNPKLVTSGINREYQLSRHCFLWEMFNSLYPAILKDFSNGSPTVVKGLDNPSIEIGIPIEIEKEVLNNKPPKIEAKKDDVKVLEYLNEQSGKAYRPTDANLSHIRERLKEGYSVEDCFVVVDNCVRDWIADQKMNKFLRTQTLFCKSKFPGYLNAKPVSLQSSESPFDDPETKRNNELVKQQMQELQEAQA